MAGLIVISTHLKDCDEEEQESSYFILLQRTGLWKLQRTDIGTVRETVLSGELPRIQQASWSSKLLSPCVFKQGEDKRLQDGVGRTLLWERSLKDSKHPSFCLAFFTFLSGALGIIAFVYFVGARKESGKAFYVLWTLLVKIALRTRVLQLGGWGFLLSILASIISESLCALIASVL